MSKDVLPSHQGYICPKLVVVPGIEAIINIINFRQYLAAPMKYYRHNKQENALGDGRGSVIAVRTTRSPTHYQTLALHSPDHT